MRTYRTTILLCAFVLLGWIWDFSLGGGIVHSIGWALALILIGGVSGLSAWSKQRHATENVLIKAEVSPADALPSIAVRSARPDELAGLIEVEIAADRLFPLAGYGETPGPADLEDLQHAACILVSGDPAVGCARLEVLDGQAHLEGLSVRPKFMRQGRGTALVEAAVAWAAEQGYHRLTLTTFADVPWNGPFYRQLGFTELVDLTAGLVAARTAERAIGLDAMGPRIAMVRNLETLAR